MTLYSYKKNYPQGIPFRIKLSDGSTRTDPLTFTDEIIADAGYVAVLDKPTINEELQTVHWSFQDVNWIIEDKTEEQIALETQSKITVQWSAIRQQRDEYLKSTDISILRDFESGNVANADVVAYRQALRDLPQTQTDPFNIIWPIIPR